MANAPPIWVKEPTRTRVGSRLLTLALRCSLSALAITPHHKNADPEVGILLLEAQVWLHVQSTADAILTLSIVLEPIG